LEKSGMKDSGMTLLELVIAMVVVGVLVLFTGPPLATILKSTKVRSATGEFVLTHSLARSTALRYGRLAELHIDAPNARYWVEVDTSGSGVRDTVGIMHNPGGQALHMTSTRSLLCFDPRGLATARGTCESPDAVVTFAMLDRADTVEVTLLGKVLR
jgi:prepilin-type N-terminal cleavage/methylation domain-containing protein